MRFIRKIMQDKSSAGAIAILAVLLFLLQGLANGVTNGSMAALALEADGIICSSHLPEGVSGKQDPAGKLANNCCGTLCRLASTSAAALLVTPIELIGNDDPKVEITFFGHAGASPPLTINRDAQPRGPPSLPQI
jgi:hypothetical protein